MYSLCLQKKHRKRQNFDTSIDALFLIVVHYEREKYLKYFLTLVGTQANKITHIWESELRLEQGYTILYNFLIAQLIEFNVFGWIFLHVEGHTNLTHKHISYLCLSDNLNGPSFENVRFSSHL